MRGFGIQGRDGGKIYADFPMLRHHPLRKLFRSVESIYRFPIPL